MAWIESIIIGIIVLAALLYLVRMAARRLAAGKKGGPACSGCGTCESDGDKRASKL